MESPVEELRRDQRRISRLTILGSALAMAIANPLLITAKLTGNLPDRAGWWYVFAVPLVCYGLLLGGVWLANRSDLKNAQKREEGPK